MVHSRVATASLSPITAEAYSYWDSKRQGRQMPSRADIVPEEITKLLPHLVLLDVAYEPLDFRYRLIGTYVRDHLRDDYTGRWMSQLPHQKPGSQIFKNCASVVETGQPFAADTPYVGPMKDFVRAHDIVMPLSNDDAAVNMLFVAVEYTKTWG